MKNILIALVLLALYAGALVFKDRQMEKEKNVYVPSIYDLQKKNGIPVKVAKVKKGQFEEYATLSGSLETTGELISSVAPSVRGRIKVGADAYMELEDGKRLKGKVAAVSNAPSVLTGLYEVSTVFSQRFPKRIASVTIDVPVKEIKGVILVPRESVSLRGEKPAVFVLDGNILSRQTVEIAGGNSTDYWIRSGLKADETVVVSDTRYFQGGEKVKITEVTRKDI